jgi:polar amino acid transport system substrate-binding protein
VSQAPAEIVKELAPTGTLRAALNLGNIVLVQTDDTGKQSGVTVDLANELARRVGVPVAFTGFDAAG